MKERKIIVRYREASDYRSLPATGVFGGPTPAGDLICNFFLETRAVPEEVEIEIDAAGAAKEKLAPTGGPEVFFREIQVGILLNPNVARSIGEWLIQRSQELLNKPVLQ
jgi:hypothetical protein